MMQVERYEEQHNVSEEQQTVSEEGVASFQHAGNSKKHRQKLQLPAESTERQSTKQQTHKHPPNNSLCRWCGNAMRQREDCPALHQTFTFCKKIVECATVDKERNIEVAQHAEDDAWFTAFQQNAQI
eukprot:GHVR01138162.1.p2 GENE.GHVR01138162.1~~GHVR01138162.1.p2  ORF type:complete len:127 (-),score=22.60 GHVR01138162.1:566-946(-)